jgi:hypothetical protein
MSLRSCAAFCNCAVFCNGAVFCNCAVFCNGAAFRNRHANSSIAGAPVPSEVA